jgi:hypothetical protein
MRAGSFVPALVALLAWGCGGGESASSGGDAGDGGSTDASAPDASPRSTDAGVDATRTDAATGDAATGDAASGDAASGDAGDAATGPGVGQSCPTGMCAQGTCTMVGATSYCTVPCPPACPNGTYCSIIGGASVCVPDLGQECNKCTSASDCKLPSDACLTAPLGDPFCARDCTVDGLCPTGFTCVNMAGYDTPDGGSPDASGDDGGADDAEASDGGTQLLPSKWCAPTNGASCTCDPQRDGVTNACSVTNALGTCTGTETCDGATSTWVGCTAQTPTADTCDGLDNDCDGTTDDGDGNSLCASVGAPPPNSSWACVNGMCELGACDPGWTDFPPGSATAGCACRIDADEPNNTCATYTSVGMVTSVGGAPILLEGTLSSATDVDVYAFTTVDAPEVGTNSYHVAIAFTQPSPDNEFVMDVLRGQTCVDAPTGPGVAVTSYDWCVNGTSASGLGEAPCGPTSLNHCADDSSQYYVRVYRGAGATPTCTTYQITVTGGGGACDLTSQCMSP